MIFRSLTLENFRNYTSAWAEFHPRMNVICGENAQGKTNFLEAVAYFSAARSHRTHSDRELIRFGADRADLFAELESRSRHFALELSLYSRAPRTIRANGVRLQRASQLGEICNTVLFCPEDLHLIQAGAAQRRAFLDNVIVQLRPRYVEAMDRYQKARRAKSAILRRQDERPDLMETLDDFSLQMCRYGAVITRYRAHFIRRLGEIAPAIHREFSGGREELRLCYQPTSTVTDPLASTDKLVEQLTEHQQIHREAELRSRKCLTGPHLDDLLIEIDGRPARQYASQGQARTAALSLKLAQRDIFFDEREEYPVLLLDDVLSELDPRRQEFVLNRIQGGQVFLTCCEEERLSVPTEGFVFRVEQGRIEKI